MKAIRCLALVGVGFLGVAVLAAVASGQDLPAPEKNPPVEEKIAEHMERLSKKFNLTEDQQEKIKAILQDKSPRLEELRQQLREVERDTQAAINAVLTEDQRAKKAQPQPDRDRLVPGRERGEFGRGWPAGFGPMAVLRDLDLTADQKAKIQEIIRSRPDDPREAIAQVLTDEQREKLKERLRAPREAASEAIAPRPSPEERAQMKERLRAPREAAPEAIAPRRIPEERAQMKERLRARWEGRREAFKERFMARPRAQMREWLSPWREGRGEVIRHWPGPGPRREMWNRRPLRGEWRDAPKWAPHER